MTAAQSTAVEAVSPRAASQPVRPQRRNWRRQLTILILVDLAMVNLAFFVAYVLRYTWEVGGDVPGESFVAYAVYLPVQVLFVGLCILGYQLRGTYSLPRESSIAAEAMSVITSSAVAAMTVFALGALIRYPASSRLIFVYAWLLACVLGIGGRVLLHAYRSHAQRHGKAGERVMVVGTNHLARMIMQGLTQQAHLGYRVIGFVDDTVRSDFGRFRALGAVNGLQNVIERESIDRVIVALPASQHSEILWVLDRCQQAGVSVSLVPDLFEMRLSHVNLETVGGIPLLAVHETSISGFNQLLKRGMDIVLSALLLLLLAPVCALIALAIKLDDGGPVIFQQVRCGKNGAPFRFYKFRSMRQGADLEQHKLMALNEADGPVFKIRDDPRLTRVGGFIRRTSLDEIPQFWNVLRGEMSLVGPRPPIPAEVEHYEDWQLRRLEVVPGITGLWQVSGRSELSFDEWVILDILYIETWSPGLDFQILARTLPAVVARAGAF
jgi:exopolysaccharide biosynthesis polyprenyl glycosylphosphotransferase